MTRALFESATVVPANITRTCARAGRIFIGKPGRGSNTSFVTFIASEIVSGITISAPLGGRRQVLVFIVHKGHQSTIGRGRPQIVSRSRHQECHWRNAPARIRRSTDAFAWPAISGLPRCAVNLSNYALALMHGALFFGVVIKAAMRLTWSIDSGQQIEGFSESVVRVTAVRSAGQRTVHRKS